VDIYMDDFIAVAQGSATTLANVRSTLFYAIDEVFRPLHPTDTPFNRSQPISIKKLNKGDARWTTRTTVLGWIVDTERETIELPQHRADRLHAILDTLLHKRRLSLNNWQKYIGELQSMVMAIPGARGLFSMLYAAISERSEQQRVRISRPIHDALVDFAALAHDLRARPTRIGELVDTLAVACGTADASGAGMGGVWLSATSDFTPFLWRATFPRKVQAQLVTDANPSGSITNSDLELAGQVAAQEVLTQHYDCRERTLAVFTDNISARAWQRKGARSSLGPSAYLLRLLALHQRHYRYRSTFDYLPGPFNVMADDASRLWNLSDNDLLTHFNSHYPQTQPWRLYALRPEMLSALTMALCCKRSEPASYLPVPTPVTLPGFDGPAIVKFWESIHPAQTLPTRYSSSKSLPTATEPAHWHPATNLSDLVRWKEPSGPSARRWPYWGPRTPDSITTANHTTPYNNSSADTAGKIALHLE
jgi:hypothetical protein